MPEAIRISLQPAEVNLQAGGETAELVASVHNTGEVLDQYDVAIEGLEHAWYTVHTPSVGLFPGDHSEVRVSLHPPKRSDIRAGDYPFLVKATSQASRDRVGSARGTLKIQPFAVFKAEMAPQRVTGRRGGSYRLMLSNSGTVDLTLDLKAADREGTCSFSYSPETVLVGPGEKKTAGLHIAPHRGWLVGPVKGYDFTVTVSPQGARGDVRTVNGTFVHRPFLASWRPLTGLLRTVVVLALLATGSVYALNLAGGPTGAQLGLARLFGQLTGQGIPSPSLPSPAAATATAAPGQLVFLAGFKEMYGANAKLVGEPIENVLYDTAGNAHQSTTKGVLLWYKATNSVFFVTGEGVYAYRQGQVVEIEKGRGQ
ncbi:MAG: hypothetical protein M1401_13760 [Chloroflexi bacterium]|nr:hypothetical protein [Chloroflexota bacterium]